VICRLRRRIGQVEVIVWYSRGLGGGSGGGLVDGGRKVLQYRVEAELAFCRSAVKQLSVESLAVDQIGARRLR
jgi:hypothetical protein